MAKSQNAPLLSKFHSARKMTARQSFAFFQHWRSRFQQDDGENEVSIERLREVGIEGFKFWPSLSVCCARYLEKKNRDYKVPKQFISNF